MTSTEILAHVIAKNAQVERTNGGGVEAYVMVPTVVGTKEKLRGVGQETYEATKDLINELMKWAEKYAD